MTAETAVAADTAIPTRRRKVPWRTRPWRTMPWRRPAPFRPERLAAVAVTLVGLAPVIAVVVQRAGRPYLPMADQAVIDLRVRDVLTFSRNTPLVGVYSAHHYQWSHPGPVMFYLVAPFTWLFGGAAWATLVGFALLQGVAVAWTARLAWKTGGLRRTVIWVSIALLSYVGTDPGVLQRPWNPSAALPFFVLFLLQCRLVAGGDTRRVLGLAFVAGFLVQTHIGYAILVAVLGGWALIRLAVVLRRDHRRVDRGEIAWPAAVVAVMWFPVLVLDPVFDKPSNLARLAHFYTTPTHLRAVGLSHALGYLGTEFRPLPPWLGGSETVSPFSYEAVPSRPAWAALAAVLVALAWWATRRRRDDRLDPDDRSRRDDRPDPAGGRRGRDDRRRRDDDGLRLLAELTALMLVAAVVSIALVQGPADPYLFFWRIVAGSATVVLTLTVLLDYLAANHLSAVRRTWTAVLAAGLLLASATVTHRVAAADGPLWPFEPATRSMLAQLRDQAQPVGPVIIRPWGTTLGGVAAALVDQLAREHKPVFVDPPLGYEIGYGRTATPGQVRWVWFVTEDSVLYSVGSRFPGARVVAVTHPLPPAEQAEFVQLQHRLWAVLLADHDGQDLRQLQSPLVAFALAHLPGMAAGDLQRLGRLNAAIGAHGCLCSVLQFPAGEADRVTAPYTSMA